MAFQIPAFNLDVTVWRSYPPPYASDAPGGTVVRGNLRMLKTAAIDTASTDGAPCMTLLVPKQTDVRPGHGWGQLADSADIVEIPTGSGRFYSVIAVDDVAKGFDNEYRLAVVQQRQAPMPLP